jgi:hypothetical protein
MMASQCHQQGLRGLNTGIALAWVVAAYRCFKSGGLPADGPARARAFHSDIHVIEYEWTDSNDYERLAHAYGE